MTKYLVTGGAGFIGSHMVKYLYEKGLNVTAADIREPDYLKDYPRVRFLRSDLTDEKNLENIVQGIDVVFHTAAIFNFFVKKDVLYNVNVKGTETLCKAARKKDVQKIVNWSSGAIYGDVYGNIRVKEYFQPYPKGNYCESKWLGELKAFEHHGKDGLDVTSIRPAAVYGPGSTYGDAQALHLLKTGIFCIKPGLKYTISSHVHVDDVVRAAYFLSKKRTKKARKASDIAYNVSDDVPTDNHKLIEKAAKLIEDKGLIGFYDVKVPGMAIKFFAQLSEKFARATKTKPLFEVEGVGLLLDGHAMHNEKIKSLGFKFLHPNLLDGLGKVIEWYEDNNWEVFKK